MTEYRHPSPNYHGAESPLLLAAYAGLQVGMASGFFAYGPGDNSSPIGYVRGCFEIAQHPTRWPICCWQQNLFRRGDVRPPRRNTAWR